jgi:ABC-type uncharacterized transport system involved in gliding motility auxiliary subunit
MKENPLSKKDRSTLLWVIQAVLAMALLFATTVWPEIRWLTFVLAAALLGATALFIRENRHALRSRSVAYGTHSIVTSLLVIALVGVLNFLVSKHPLKLDLTKNHVNTLSDQTVKVVRGLDRTVKAVHYSKITQRDQVRPLLDNLKALSTKFEVEYVDPDKEPARAKTAGIRKYGTLQLVVGARDTKIEEPSEEKITNSLIKLLKDKAQVLCAITGHREKSFGSQDAEGYGQVKSALEAQAYTVRDLNLTQEPKVPDECSAIAMLGPAAALFPQEARTLEAYLANGGRAVIALDLNLKGSEFAPEMSRILESWHVKPVQAMVIDPFSRMLGVDASVPILATFSKDHPITRDFQGNCYFPFVRPIEVVPGAPAGMNAQWLAQTTPKSWKVTDLKQLATGQIKMDPGKDQPGAQPVAVAVEGKLADSKAPRATRLVVFGTSAFATNNFSRYGGNVDFFMNAASWVLEDESLISIRAREEGSSKLELSQKQGTFIFLLTVILVPVLVVAAGIVIWALRRKM